MDEIDLKEFHCEICDKYYSSIQSLSNHRRIKHCNHNVTKKVTKKCEKEKIVTKNVTKSYHSDENILECKYCFKILANRHSKWRHEKTCNSSIQINKLNKENVVKTYYIKLILTHDMINHNYYFGEKKLLNNTYDCRITISNTNFLLSKI